MSLQNGLLHCKLIAKVSAQTGFDLLFTRQALSPLSHKARCLLPTGKRQLIYHIHSSNINFKQKSTAFPVESLIVY